MVYKPKKTYSDTFTNVGAQVGDYLIRAVNVGMTKGRIKGLRVQCTATTNVTSFQIAAWKVNPSGWYPEKVSCHIWSEDITTTESFMAGWDFDEDVELTGNLIYIGIKMTGTSVVDCYSVEIDVESDE